VLPGGLDESGRDLFFQAVTSQVSSAPESLTAVFGMGTGVASLSYPPERVTIEGAQSRGADAPSGLHKGG
jgi:hypothetical protein